MKIGKLKIDSEKLKTDVQTAKSIGGKALKIGGTVLGGTLVALVLANTVDKPVSIDDIAFPSSGMRKEISGMPAYQFPKPIASYDTDNNESDTAWEICQAEGMDVDDFMSQYKVLVQKDLLQDGQIINVYDNGPNAMKTIDIEYK